MSRYADAHKNPKGAGDARPTGVQIIKDEGLEGKLKDKIFLVTGVSSGIGIETGRALAATGARVFLAARNLSKAREACASFLSPGRVDLIELDTSSLASVRAAAAAVLAQTDSLNGLICNAGIMMVPTREVSTDGFELQLATNYLGHFLLFWLLKDALLKGSTPEFQSRLVNVSSAAHHAGEINFDDIQLEREGAYEPASAYGRSKLAQIYQANYVERHFGARGLHALSLMPGGIWTGLQQHVSDEMKAGWSANEAIQNFMKSPEQGASTTVYAAVSKEWEGKGGKYLEDCAVARSDETLSFTSGVKEFAYDEEKEEKLWKLTLEILGLKE